ncbi:MAG TPA: class I SAM-dependent methyltransferase [Acidimicrobiales bacterium]
MTAPVAAALLAIAGGDTGRARAAARAAADADPGDQLAAALSRYLDRAGHRGVYDEPSGFEQFIDNGSNPHLYERTIAELGRIHRAASPATLLDVGCGDGRVTAGVLVPTTRRVDLVEPSAELLRAAVARLGGSGAEVIPHRATLAEHLASLDETTGWDLVQSTFALHTTPPGERPGLLRGLARRTRRLVVAEFDVPAFADRSPAHAAYAAERYQRGVREYAGFPDVVTGFLLPVLVGQFDPARSRHTFEQPIAAWVDQLAAAGFERVATVPLADYWWAPAVLVDATR